MRRSTSRCSGTGRSTTRAGRRCARIPGRAWPKATLAGIPESGAEGVLLSQGSRHGGYALYVAGDRLVFVHNYLGLERFTVRADEPLPRRRVGLRMEFAPVGPMSLIGRGTAAEVRLFY